MKNNYLKITRLFWVVLFVFSLTTVHAQYTVTTMVFPASPVGGVITGAEGSFTSGQTVTLTAEPNDGYEFYRWMDGTGFHTENPYSFTITDNTTVRAFFNVAQVRYNVSVVNGTPGSEQYVTISGAGQKVQGEVFTLSATYSYPYNGCHWYLNGQEVSGGDSYTYTNNGDGIQSDLEFTVYFDYIPQQRTVTIAANNASRGTVQIVNNTESTSASTTLSNPSASLSVYENQSFTLTATPASNDWTFAGWKLNDATDYISTVSPYDVTFPVGSDNRTYTAVFTNSEDEYTMTASINDSRAGAFTPNQPTTVRGNQEYRGFNVTRVNSGWVFDGWFYTNGTLFSSEMNPIIERVTSNYTLVATFHHEPYHVTASVHPAVAGTVTIATPNNQGTYDAGSTVTLTASPNGNYRFLNWSNGISGTTPSVQIQNIAADYYDIHANFINTFTFTATDAHLEITASAAPHDINGMSRYDSNTSFSVRANNYDGHVFSHWNIDGVDNPNATANPYSVQALDHNMTLEPVYLPTYTVRLDQNPRSVGAALEGAGDAYTQGVEVTVSVSEFDRASYHFDGWTDDNDNNRTVSTSENYSFNITANTSLTAQFTENIRYTAVTTSIVGNGQIASEQLTVIPGRDEDVILGSEITISQTASDGWHFVKWTVNGVDSYGQTVTFNASNTTNNTVVATFGQTSVHHVTVASYPANDPNIQITGLNPNGEYADGEALDLHAGARGSNYTFLAWFKNGVPFSGEPTIHIEHVTSDLDFVAYFIVGENPGQQDYLIYDDDNLRTTVVGVNPDYVNRITTAFIPSTVTTIAEGAFRGCTALTTIAIPATVTTLGDYVFDGCTALTSITLHDGLTLGEYVFHNCSALQNVTLPADLTAIPEGLFQGCSALTSVDLPAGITSIGAYAYNGCSTVYSISLPASVETVGAQAFASMPGLHFVNLSAGIVSLGNDCFRNTNSIVSTNFNGTLEEWLAIEFGNANSQPVSRSRNLSFNGAMLSQLVIPDGVTEIKPYAFFNDTLITTLTLPAGITNIDNLAFGRLSNLQRIVLQGMPAQVHADAFQMVDRENVIVEVPCADYTPDMTWNGFNHCTAIGVPVLTLMQRPGGMVTITEAPDCNSAEFTYVISATYGINNTFLSWSDGNTDNPRTITLTEDLTLSPIWSRSPNAVSVNEKAEGYGFDFEDPEDNASWFAAGSGANAWMVGSASHYGRYGKGLYVSNDGVNNTYDDGSSPYVYSEFKFEPGFFRVKFDFMVAGNEHDFLSVGLFKENGDYIDLTPHTPGLMLLADSLYGFDPQQDDWQYKERYFRIDDAGWYRLAFFWTTNDDDIINNPAAAIDNIVVQYENENTFLNRSVRVRVSSNDQTMGYAYTNSGTDPLPISTTTVNRRYYYDEQPIEIHAVTTNDLLYRFVRWSDGDINPDRTLDFMEIYGTNPSLQAIFEEIPDHYTIDVDIEAGAVDGALQFGVDVNGTLMTHAEIANANPATIKLNLPQSGWAFMGWWNGTDTIHENPYNYTAGTDIHLIALMKQWQPCVGDNVEQNFDFGLFPNGSHFEYRFPSNDDVVISNVSIRVDQKQIVVEEATGVEVKLYDVNGRLLNTLNANGSTLRIDVPASGSYMVKIGDYLTKKVVVIK